MERLKKPSAASNGIISIFDDFELFTTDKKLIWNYQSVTQDNKNDSHMKPTYTFLIYNLDV